MTQAKGKGTAASEPTNLATKRKAGRPAEQDGLDPFSLGDSGSYDVTEFYIRSTDSHGHSENFQSRVPPEVGAEISALVQSGRIPQYKTAQSFIRDAIVHRLWYIAHILDDRDLQRQTAIEIRLARAEAKRSEIRAMGRTVDEYRSLFEEARNEQDWDIMERAVEDAESIVDLMRDPYKEKIKELTKQARKELMAAVKGK